MNLQGLKTTLLPRLPTITAQTAKYNHTCPSKNARPRNFKSNGLIEVV